MGWAREHEMGGKQWDAVSKKGEWGEVELN